MAKNADIRTTNLKANILFVQLMVIFAGSVYIQANFFISSKYCQILIANKEGAKSKKNPFFDQVCDNSDLFCMERLNCFNQYKYSIKHRIVLMPHLIAFN